MIDDMGNFRTTVGVSSLTDPRLRLDVDEMMVDSLEALNLRVDLGRKELVPAGPVPAAAAA